MIYLHRLRKLGENNFETKIIILWTVLTSLLERDACPRHAGLKVIFEQLKYSCPDNINNHIFNYCGKCSSYNFRNSFSFFFLNVALKDPGKYFQIWKNLKLKLCTFLKIKYITNH